MAKKQEVEVSLFDLLQLATSNLATVSAQPNMHMYQPHPKQEQLHCSVALEKLFIGGNRSGKTVWNVMECIWWLTKKHPFREDVNSIIEPIRGRLVSVSFIDGVEKIIIPYFKQFLPESEMKGGSWESAYTKSTRMLTLANGSFIEFMSYDQDTDSFAGTSRHFVAFDEEPPQAIFIECKMRLMDTGGSFWISMTPVEGMTWVYYELYEPWKNGTDPDLQVLEINTNENPNVDSVQTKRVMKGLSEDDKKARQSGEFIQVGGRVFPTFNKAMHKLDEFTLSRDMVIYMSYDHGWRHPAAILWHAILPNQHIVTFHEIVVSMHTVKDLAALILEYERQALEPLGMQTFLRPADPATYQTSAINGMSIAQTFALHNVFLSSESIPKGPNSVAVGLDKMQQYIRMDPDTNTPFWQYFDCPIFERQMEHLHFDKFASKKLEYDSAPKLTINQRDDDAPDSARYMFTLMPDLYVMDGKEEKRIRTNAGGLSAAMGSDPWNTRAGVFDTPLPDNRISDYTIYEGSDMFALENY